MTTPAAMPNAIADRPRASATVPGQQPSGRASGRARTRRTTRVRVLRARFLVIFDSAKRDEGLAAASSGVSPLAISCSVSSSMCSPNPDSCATGGLAAEPETQTEAGRVKPSWRAHVRAQDGIERRGELLPAFHFFAESTTAGGRQSVVARLAVLSLTSHALVIRVLLETLEGGIERTLVIANSPSDICCTR